MPETFVLIHGAWHTGEDFEPIANILRDAGHTVYCPTLRGNRPEDDRSKLGLEDAISSGVEFIEVSDLTDIRLVGHSYAGMVISGVADRLEKRPRRLVYINAFVPLKGQSLNDMVMPDYAAAFAAIAEANNGAILLPFEIWRENFINDADIALARSTYDRLNPKPYRTFTDKISLQRPLSELSIGKSYINCQQDIACRTAIRGIRGCRSAWAIQTCGDARKSRDHLFKSNWTRSSNLGSRQRLTPPRRRNTLDLRRLRSR
jgi:pimeloyl-ACP methyl ester carboxylesterase